MIVHAFKRVFIFLTLNLFFCTLIFLAHVSWLKILLTRPAQKANVKLACFELFYSKFQHYFLSAFEAGA